MIRAAVDNSLVVAGASHGERPSLVSDTSCAGERISTNQTQLVDHC